MKYVIDYGIIGLLIFMSLTAFAIAIERCLFFRGMKVFDYADRKSLEMALTERLHLIASIGSNAPYIGLLGTVLGI
ncbi:MAG: MotA/TolQ/ExbB proton channel family protein, partial [Desulfobulbales bacterium]